jgi:ketosteroid isomerase-like protein
VTRADDLDRADVVAEVRAAFEAYEAALVAHDLAALDAAFWADPRVVRFGIADDQVGADAIAAWRRAAGPVTPGRALHDTKVTAFGTDLAIVTTKFTDDARGVGRQSQVWMRIERRWRIVGAHVSRVDDIASD